MLTKIRMVMKSLLISAANLYFKLPYESNELSENNSVDYFYKKDSKSVWITIEYPSAFIFCYLVLNDELSNFQTTRFQIKKFSDFQKVKQFLG